MSEDATAELDPGSRQAFLKWFNGHGKFLTQAGSEADRACWAAWVQGRELFASILLLELDLRRSQAVPGSDRAKAFSEIEAIVSAFRPKLGE